jgi:predicted ATPase/class 3 adenylate cyclase
MLSEGFVTFLFSDIEGSIRLWEQYPDSMGEALARHDEILHEAIEENGGSVFKTVGDAFCSVFARPADAVRAAVAAQKALAEEPWRDVDQICVRMAAHTGEAELRSGDYYGPALNRVARLLNVGHGGQILISGSTHAGLAGSIDPEIELRDMGSHRLKDLQRPEHVWQVIAPELPDELPPLRSLQAFANNLPIQATSFVGRKRQLEEVKNLLRTERIVTLAGPGGTGKTRLALQVAADNLEDYGDGVWLVELAPVLDEAQVPQALATVLGVREESGKGIHGSITDYLQSKQTLVILDNCEHVIDAAARVADLLCRSCPDVVVLATTREPLGVPGEHVYRVPTLGVPGRQMMPTPESLTQYESVRLFFERARVHQPEFVVTGRNAPAVARVCRQLDGLPLAIELAAARIRALPVEQLAERLDDRFQLLTGGARTALPRQQTLRALIDWSYDLLTEQEQTMLRRLSVFVGGWALEDAEQVCAGDGILEYQVLDLLTSLVDKSLVTYEQRDDAQRYGLLETVLQYARERLSQTDEFESLRLKHREHFLAFAEKIRSEFHGPNASQAFDRVEAEHDNLRTAMAAFESDPDGGVPGLRLAGALQRFCDVRGYFSEGRERYKRALAHRGAQEATRARADVLNGLGNLADHQGDYEAAREAYKASMAIWREIGDTEGLARALGNLGILAERAGEYDRARSLHVEARELFRQAGNRNAQVIGLLNMASLSIHQKDYDLACRELEESKAMCEELDNRTLLLYAVDGLGDLALLTGRFDEAREYLARGIELCCELGNPSVMAVLLQSWAELAVRHGGHERAARLFGAVDTLRRSIGSPANPQQQERLTAQRAEIIDAIGEEAFETAFATGTALSADQAADLALMDAKVMVPSKA